MPLYGNRPWTSAQLVQGFIIIFVRSDAWNVALSSSIDFSETNQLITTQSKLIRRLLRFLKWFLWLIEMVVTGCLVLAFGYWTHSQVILLLPIALSPNSSRFRFLINLIIIWIDFAFWILQAMLSDIFYKSTILKVPGIRPFLMLHISKQGLKLVGIWCRNVSLLCILNCHGTHC